MNTFARRRLDKGCAIALLLLAGCAAAAPVEESVSRVSVAFIEPEKFTDARRAELEPTSSGILRELEKFLIEDGACYVPADMRLNIRVTNIDLAGDFELFRGPQADHVRIAKGLIRRTSCSSSSWSIARRKWSKPASATSPISIINRATFTRGGTTYATRRICCVTGCAPSLAISRAAP